VRIFNAGINHTLGVTLEEMNLDGCYPYKFYLANRFGVPVGESSLVERAQELLKEAKEEFQEEVFQLNEEL